MEDVKKEWQGEAESESRAGSENDGGIMEEGEGGRDGKRKGMRQVEDGFGLRYIMSPAFQ